MRANQNQPDVATGNEVSCNQGEATRRLARIWELGGFSDAAIQIEICKDQSRAWNWGKANAAMAAAYRALGAEAPEVKVNAIHTGSHPVQILCAFSQKGHL